MRIIIIILLLIVCIILGALVAQCNNPFIPPPAPITAAPVTITPPPSLTPTLTPTLQPTDTPTPTETISPTSTELPPTETATPTVTPTQTRVVIPPGRPNTIPTTGATLPDYGALVLLGYWLAVFGGAIYIEAQRKQA